MLRGEQYDGVATHPDLRQKAPSSKGGPLDRGRHLLGLRRRVPDGADSRLGSQFPAIHHKYREFATYLDRFRVLEEKPIRALGP